VRGVQFLIAKDEVREVIVTFDSDFVKNKTQEEEEKKQQKPCYQFILHNVCTKGPKCQHSHGVDDKTVAKLKKKFNKPCKYWKKKGYCNYRNKCWYQHDAVPLDSATK
jgi:hypothetical protein